MIKDIHSAGLNVLDLEAAISFYGTEGAYEVAERFDIADDEATQAAYCLSNPKGKGALLRGHGGFLELTQFDEAFVPQQDKRGVGDAGVNHICIRTRDANELFDRLVDNGAGSHARPAQLGTGIDYAYMRDPEGNLVEIEGLPMLPPGVIKPWFDHGAIVTHDMDQLASFYSLLTEHEVVRRETFGPEPKFDKVAGIEGIVFEGAWIMFGLSRLEMWEYKSPATTKRPALPVNTIGWSHLCFEVDSLVNEQARLSDAGVEFVGDAKECSIGQSVLAKDVDGNVLKLLQVAEDRPDLSVENLPARPILKLVRDHGEKPQKVRTDTVDA